MDPKKVDIVKFPISGELQEMLENPEIVENEIKEFSTNLNGETYDIFKESIGSKKSITLMILDSLFEAYPIFNLNRALIKISNKRTCNVMTGEPDGAHTFHTDHGTLIHSLNLVISWGLGTEVINYWDSLLIDKIRDYITRSGKYELFTPFCIFKEEMCNNPETSIEDLLITMNNSDFSKVVNIIIQQLTKQGGTFDLPRNNVNTSPNAEGMVEGIMFPGNITYHRRMPLNLRGSFWRFVLNLHFNPESFQSPEKATTAGGKKHHFTKSKKRKYKTHKN